MHNAAAQLKPLTIQKRWQTFLLILLTLVVFAAFLGFALHRAWIGDDGFITLRVADNFVHGYGPVWNVGERVQAYTHPLWLFLLSAVYAVTREPYFTTITLGLFLSFLTAYFLCFRVARAWESGLIGVLCLALSTAFLDYSTSGLENPLTHLLLVLFAWAYFRGTESLRRLFVLSLLGSLLAVNRLDAFLLVLPALIFAWGQRHSLRSLGVMLLGQFPLLLWEGFSLVYYGFLIPNTAVAKLYTGLPRLYLLARGLDYLKYTAVIDPWTLLAMVLGLLSLLLARSNRRRLAFAAGMLLYLAYVVFIGGDFMGGRFLTAPFLMAVILLVQLSFTKKKRMLWVLLGMIAVGFSLFSFIWPWRNTPTKEVGSFIAMSGIADERSYYYSGNGLFSGYAWKDLPAYYQRYGGEELRRNGSAVIEANQIGMLGYYAGPQVYIVDGLALSNAFLARLHPDGGSIRIGHFTRRIPPGYVETLQTGTNHITDPRLHAYYDHLQPIVRGSLWSRQRWHEIVQMNLGRYEYLVADYR
jgi:arabinofuranosyltransferase